jgi:hypothetical protein
MTSSMLRGRGKRLLTIAMAISAFMGMTAASAYATPEVSVSPSTVGLEEMIPSYPVVTVEGTGFEAHQGKENIRIGICSKRGIVFGVPACGLFKPVSISEAGTFSTGLTLTPQSEETAIFANAHSPIPGMPATFDCIEEQIEYQGCEIAVVEHGKSPVFLAKTPITFE